MKMAYEGYQYGRIAGALERIADSLERLEKRDDSQTIGHMRIVNNGTKGDPAMIEGEHLEIEPVQYYVTITVEEYQSLLKDSTELARLKIEEVLDNQ